MSTCILVALVGETGQSARVRTRKGSETLTIVCRVEVTATIVCVKCVVSIVKIKGDYSRYCNAEDRTLRYCTHWSICIGLCRTMEYQVFSTRHLEATTGMFTFFCAVVCAVSVLSAFHTDRCRL